MTNLNIFGLNIPTYGLCTMVGIIFTFLYVLLTAKSKKQVDDCAYILFISLIFAFIGAKLLYLITVLKEILNAENALTALLNTIRGGLVFYGGLFGALFGFYLSVRYFKLDMDLYGKILLPCIPLFHSFGRLGCLLVGCCHGKETDSSFHIMYKNSNFAPNNVNLIPVQGLEITFELACFTLLAVLIRKYKYMRFSFFLRAYLVFYSVFRFINEFFRGDAERGFVLFLSTSQFISILTIVSVFLYNFINFTHKRPINHS